jgi:two-component system chemotaxis sensor kinase CheA
MFRVEGRLYAVPLNAVAEIARARESDLHKVENHEILQLRNQALSVVRLGRPAPGSAGSKNKIFVLVIQLGDRRLGLIVDGLSGEEELVIKPLDDQTMETDLVSGASILGDGRVVLILNLAAVLERTHRQWSGGDAMAPHGMLLSRANAAAASGSPGGRP